MLVIRLAPVRSLIEVLVFEKEMFLKNILLINSSEKKTQFQSKSSENDRLTIYSTPRIALRTTLTLCL